MNECIHFGEEKYPFTLPYGIGKQMLCWECRRELALRLHAYPEWGVVNIDSGRFGYGCTKCKGTFTSTDPMTCKCEGRKEQCAAEAKAQAAFSEYAKLVLWKPKKSGVRGYGESK